MIILSALMKTVLLDLIQNLFAINRRLGIGNSAIILQAKSLLFWQGFFCLQFWNLEFDLLELGICPTVGNVFFHKRRNESLPVADRRQDFTLGKLGKRNVLKNYIKIAIRTILRHKGYSFINVVGLAIGMNCCPLILVWVLDELRGRERNCSSWN